jgi:hypothetical protein
MLKELITASYNDYFMSLRQGRIQQFLSIYCIYMYMHTRNSKFLEGNATAALASSKACKCVDCCEDILCGGTWSATTNRKVTSTLSKLSFSVVISHCDEDVCWMPSFFHDAVIPSIHIYSKCGKRIKCLPDLARVTGILNVGREAYPFLLYLVTKSYHAETDYTLFLADNNQSHFQAKSNYRALHEMVDIMNFKGFACALENNILIHDPPKTGTVEISPYNDLDTLQKFSLRQHYTDDKKSKSKFLNFGEWASSLGILYDLKYVEVCHGGSFGVLTSLLSRHPTEFYRNLMNSVIRGENVEETYFMERAWGVLFSNNLTSSQIDSLDQYSDGIITANENLRGSLYILHGKKKETTQYRNCT